MNSKKKCINCKDYFPSDSILTFNRRNFCSYECATSYAQKKSLEARQKQERKENKAAKERIKTLAQLAKEAQTEFNKFIRERDKNLPCISCQRHHDGQYHAGHYKTVGAHPELRFNEDNCHKQCSVCNNHLSGNLVNYRENLIKKIGIKRVEKLESYNPPKKYTREELVALKEKYRKLSKSG